MIKTILNKHLLTLAILVAVAFEAYSQQQYKSLDGRIIFSSSKNMNMLSAFSENVLTHIIPAKNKISFKVQITSFNFSNCSRLVEKLFNDVYLESHKYHWAQFEGRTIDTINFEKSGEYLVSVKGNLTIHGVEKERIIQGKITVRDTKHIGFDSTFPVLLSDHNIGILPDDIARLSDTIEVQVSTAIKMDK